MANELKDRPAFVLTVGVNPTAVATALSTARHGFACDHAADAAQAIERAQVRPPDVVIVGGRAAVAAAVVEALMEDPATERASFIAWPAEGDRADRARLVALGPRLATRSTTALRQACDEALDAREGRTVLVEMPTFDDGSPDAVDLRAKRVVVADDDPAIVWFFADALRGAGCEVTEAADGEHALDLARRHMPDVVLSDIRMPALDGIRLCRALRADPLLADVPVVLLSWREDWLLRAWRDAACGSAYLTKRSTPEEALACVRRALAPHAKFERRLRRTAPARGRLYGVSPYRLLRLVCDGERDARVTLRDRTHLYEVHVRAGEPRAAACLASDGLVTPGREALGAMLAVRAGRFAVVPEDGPVDAELRGALHELIAEHVATARGGAPTASPAAIDDDGGVVVDVAVVLTATPPPGAPDAAHVPSATGTTAAAAELPVRTLPLLRGPARRYAGMTPPPAIEATVPLAGVGKPPRPENTRTTAAAAAPRPDSPSAVPVETSMRRSWRPWLRVVGVAAVAILGLALGAGFRALRRSAGAAPQSQTAEPAPTAAPNTRAARLPPPHPR